jgi:hypothetical protein
MQTKPKIRLAMYSKKMVLTSFFSLHKQTERVFGNTPFTTTGELITLVRKEIITNESHISYSTTMWWRTFEI